MKQRQPTRAEIIKSAEAALVRAQQNLDAVTFFNQLYVGVIHKCWQRVTGGQLPEGLVDYVITVCTDVIRHAGTSDTGMKFDGHVAAALDTFLGTSESATPATASSGLIVSPAEAHQEALGGAPLILTGGGK